MGQAKKRGSFEKRQVEAIERNRIAAEEAAKQHAAEAARREEQRRNLAAVKPEARRGLTGRRHGMSAAMLATMIVLGATAGRS